MQARKKDLKMEIRGVVEGWPALMSLEMTTRYLSITSDAFYRLAQDHHLHPVDVEGAAVMWRKADLDRLVRQLPTSRESLSGGGGSRLFRLETGQVDAIAEALALKLAPDPKIANRKLVSIKEASSILGVGRSSIYRMIEDGRLETTRIGRRTLVRLVSINAVIESN